MFHQDLAQTALFKSQGDLIDGRDIQGLNHRFWRHITKQADFLAELFAQGVFAAAQQRIGLQPDFTQAHHRMLRRFGLHFTRCPNIGHQCQVDIEGIFTPFLQAELTDGLQKRQAFNVAHRPSHLDDGHIIRIPVFGHGVNPPLDFVGDVGDHLDGFAQIISPAFARDDFKVYLPGGRVVLPSHAYIQEPLIMPQVQVGFGAVIGDIDLAVLKGAHGSRVYIDIRIEFQHGDAKTPGLQQHPN